jgi:hypothetical protein
MIFTEHHKWGYRKVQYRKCPQVLSWKGYFNGKFYAFATLDNFDFNLTQNKKRGV